MRFRVDEPLLRKSYLVNMIESPGPMLYGAGRDTPVNGVTGSFPVIAVGGGAFGPLCPAKRRE
jgi:hypothetical protein